MCVLCVTCDTDGETMTQMRGGLVVGWPCPPTEDETKKISCTVDYSYVHTSSARGLRVHWTLDVGRSTCVLEIPIHVFNKRSVIYNLVIIDLA